MCVYALYIFMYTLEGTCTHDERRGKGYIDTFFNRGI